MPAQPDAQLHERAAEEAQRDRPAGAAKAADLAWRDHRGIVRFRLPGSRRRPAPVHEVAPGYVLTARCGADAVGGDRTGDPATCQICLRAALAARRRGGPALGAAIAKPKPVSRICPVCDRPMRPRPWGWRCGGCGLELK